MKYWDAHNHTGDTKEETAAYFKDYDKYDIEKGVFLGLTYEKGPFSNLAVLDAAKEYGDRVIPFAFIDLDQGQPSDIEHWMEKGFVGLKVIGTANPFDHDSYLPFYEKAQEAGVPILFHTGYQGNAKACKIDNYRPIYIVNLAKRFPRLKMICAHFGNPWWEEAYLAICKMPNVYCDFSGMTLRYRPFSLLEGIFSRAGQFDEKAFSKVLFGSDFEIADQVAYHETVFEHFKVGRELRDKVCFGNLQALLA